MITNGYTLTETTRLTSRLLDNAGVDLVETGSFHIQAKYITGHVSYRKVLARMPLDKTPIIIHGKPYKKSIVALSIKDAQKFNAPMPGPTLIEEKRNITDPFEVLENFKAYIHKHPDSEPMFFARYETFEPVFIEDAHTTRQTTS